MKSVPGTKTGVFGVTVPSSLISRFTVLYVKMFVVCVLLYVTLFSKKENYIFFLCESSNVYRKKICIEKMQILSVYVMGIVLPAITVK